MHEIASNQCVWIVVLNWRNGPDTVECLQSVLDSAPQHVQGIIICDNNSQDASVEQIRRWASGHGQPMPEFYWRDGGFDSARECEARSSSPSRPETVLIHTGANLGFAGGNNVGIEYIRRHCKYDFVFLLNNDALLTPDTVASMVARFADKQVGLCGCTVVYYHAPSKVQAYGGASFEPWLGRARHIGAGAAITDHRNADAVEKELDYILGAALMISRPCLEAVGLLEERYFLYFEEIDWATRARRKGFRLAYAPDAVVFHKEGGTIGSSTQKGKRSLLSEHYLVRSRILFTRKFYPHFLPTVLAFTFAQIMRVLLRRDIRRFVVGLRAMTGKPFVKGARA